MPGKRATERLLELFCRELSAGVTTVPSVPS